MHELDLAEIQSMDSHEIVKDKLKRAYKILQTPLIVEDVACGLDSLEGLPGPFFKFFEKALGKQALLRLSQKPNEAVTITCVAGYYDGKNMLFGVGSLKGKVVQPRGDNGFGFDPVIVPEGETRTMAEMAPEEKSAISHRGQAFRALLQQIKA